MRVVLAAVLMLSAFVSTAAAASENGQHASNANGPFMRVYGAASPPFGFVHFCERHPTECSGGDIPQARLAATPQRLSELDDVNRAVNRAIRPATDEELYNLREWWTLPEDAGDCEDYALLKRQTLIRRGWPASALLMTVVRDHQGDGHAVLTVRTSHGDFVLDNKVDEVRLWNHTGYAFVMRQSFVDPRLWMSLAPSSDGDRSQLLTSNPTTR